MTANPDAVDRSGVPTSWPAAVTDAVRSIHGDLNGNPAGNGDLDGNPAGNGGTDEVAGAQIVATGPGRWETSGWRIAMIDGASAPHADVLARAVADPASFVVAGATLAYAEDGWIVASRPAGHPADRPDLHADPDDLVVAVGAGLRALHELVAPQRAGPAVTVDADPAGWEALAERCRRAVADGAVHRAALPAPYDRYDDETLLAMVIDGRPSNEAPCICHGRPELGEFMVEGGRFTGFANLDRLVVADPHLDLAVIHQGLHHQLGPEAVFRFYESYGADPDIVRLDHYILVGHLLGLSLPVAADGQSS